MSDLSIAIIGNGKMGRAVGSVAHDEGIRVTAMIGAGEAITAVSLAGAEIAIEFTEPGAAVHNIFACIEAGCPIVVGTTGWFDRLDEVSHLVRDRAGTLFWAANFSPGVHIFAEIVRYAGELVARAVGFDAHLIETHHTAKKDAPSGTALMLQQEIASGLGRPVPITSVRVGSVPGTHELVLDAQYEQLTLAHLARDRRVFAEGAVAAARWLRGRYGVFTMADMLGLQQT